MTRLRALALVDGEHYPEVVRETLAGLPYAYFDQNKSGAVLAWEWAHENAAPWLLQYIQDKDLWTWALPGSREINAAIALFSGVAEKIREQAIAQSMPPAPVQPPSVSDAVEAVPANDAK